LRELNMKSNNKCHNNIKMMVLAAVT
jgi:hypothetical protein